MYITPTASSNLLAFGAFYSFSLFKPVFMRFSKNDIINGEENASTCNREIGREFCITNIREKYKRCCVNFVLVK